jgi:hypothetical protein
VVAAGATDFNALLDAADGTQKVRRLDADTIGFGNPATCGKLRELAGGYVRLLCNNEQGYYEIAPNGTLSLVSAGAVLGFDFYALKLDQAVAFTTRESTALDGTPQSPLAAGNRGWHDLTASSPTVLRGYGWNTYPGGVKYLVNDGPADVTCHHEDAAVLTWQRFRCPGGANLVLPAGGLAVVQYDGSRQRVWRVA